MPEPVVPTSAKPSAALTPSVDFEVLRAQVVNCLLHAAMLLCEQNPGVVAHPVFGRFSNLSVLMTLQSAQFETRIYIFRLLNPDGSQANLMRVDDAGHEVAFDEVDHAYASAIGHSLGPTVQAAWRRMVPEEPSATHRSDHYVLH